MRSANLSQSSSTELIRGMRIYVIAKGKKIRTGRGYEDVEDTNMQSRGSKYDLMTDV